MIQAHDVTIHFTEHAIRVLIGIGSFIAGCFVWGIWIEIKRSTFGP